MYTSYPLQNIDTVNNHVGFYFVLAVWILWFAAAAVGLYNAHNADVTDDQLKMRIADAKNAYMANVIVGGIILLITGIVSFNTGEIKNFTNTPVHAVRVNIVAEVGIVSQTQGKQTVKIPFHYLYVQYKVPEGIVTFKIHEGQAWPETAILYRN